MKKINKMLSMVFLTSMVLNPVQALAYTKSETIYSNLDYNGKPITTVVNNHLSKLEKTSIEDQTLLQEITNLNGDEKYRLKNNKLTWEANGNDIFYQGKLEESSPISVQIEYYLNDKISSPKKMVGKKGKVTIKVKLENKAYDETQNLHTPFVVTLGTIFSNTENTNITVTNGEVVDTGTRSIVAALAAPGLYHDLKIDEFKTLDEIQIQYQTTSFSLQNIYLVATPKLLEKVDLSTFDQMSTLSNSMNTIQKNMDKLEAGAKEISKGATTLSSGSDEITKNLKTARNALTKLEDGSVAIDSGLSQILASLENAKAALKDKNITGSITNLSALKEANTSAIATLNATNTNLQETYMKYALNNFHTDQELITYFSNLNVDENTIQNLLTCKKTYEGNLSLITLLSTNNGAIDTMISSLQETATTIDTLITELSTAITKLEAGTKEITNGLKEVGDGIDKLYAGSSKLTEGSKTLESATTTLSNGTSTLNKVGINTLTNATNVLNNYSDITKKLVNLSKNYKGFASNNTDHTLFIYKVKSAK